jgi:hypothetical protein
LPGLLLRPPAFPPPPIPAVPGIAGSSWNASRGSAACEGSY